MLTNCRTYLRWIAVTLVLCVLVPPTIRAQSGGARKVLTLEQAVDFSLKNYPAVRGSLERVGAAQAGIGLAQTSYLPRADVVWQMNRATDTNITGSLLPQSIVDRFGAEHLLRSPLSRAIPTRRRGRCTAVRRIVRVAAPAWGSAAGLLFSWEPVDFEYRGAKVDAARAVRDRVTAEASLTRLDVAVATVNAYLTMLAAQQTVHAAEADVQRRETFDKAVKGQEHIAREGLGLRAIAQGSALPGISDEERLPRNTHSTTRCMNTSVRSRTSGSKTNFWIFKLEH